MVRVPVACLGLLQYMRCQLAQRDYYHEASSLTSAPAYLRLSLLIARQQPELRLLGGRGGEGLPCTARPSRCIRHGGFV